MNKRRGMMERVARFMEVFWLVLAVLGAIWALYAIGANGWQQGRIWILFPVICTGMWGWRRFMRGRIAEWAQRERDREHAKESRARH